jgi:PPK2 family polyphosphate:nucleotide phosphotransferase
VDARIVPFSPASVSLSDYDPASKAGFARKRESAEALRTDIESMVRLDDMFAAQRDRAMLVVLQGMDAAGKDGIIKHVMSGINPQNIGVHGFRKPSDEELLHDYLWRAYKVLPERGRVAIFNRSYYEEVLVVRVKPSLLKSESVTPNDDEWSDRYSDINAFERHLTRCGTIVLKFFLHLSKGEQRKRLCKRLEMPTKMWKASDADLEAHDRWDAYVRAYEQMLGNTSTPWAPWYVVPADRKWAARLVVGGVIVETLEKLGLRYPEPSARRRELFAKLAEKLGEETT